MLHRFWGAQKVEIASIQILPVTPVNEYLYDATWAKNVWSYTAGEVADPTIDDEWKCLIYLLYSTVNPQQAAISSSSLTGWGSGNTYTNQLYFLSTRPNPTGQPICSSSNSNPSGNFVIQNTATGKFVVSTASNTNLVASATAQSGATTFNFAFSPNAGTIKNVATSQFVTADQSGSYVISSSRASASSWEKFVIRQKSGAATGVYTIQAGSNKDYITVQSDGSLINNGAAVGNAATFKFIAV